MPRPTGPRPTGARRLRDHFGERLQRRADRLTPTMATVAAFIDGNRHAVLGLSALGIGSATGTSDATVIRTIQALGFSGLRELKDTLDAWLGETDSPVEKMAQTSAALGPGSVAGGAADRAIDLVLENQAATMAALAAPENRAAMAAAVRLIAGAKALGLFGIGASGMIADYAARLFSRSGLPARAYNATGIALAEQLLDLAPGHVLVMLLHGRPHREALASLAEAKALGVPVVMLLGRADTPLIEAADVALVLPRARADRVALHAPALVALEALHLAVSAELGARPVETLDRLVRLRSEIRPHSR